MDRYRCGKFDQLAADWDKEHETSAENAGIAPTKNLYAVHTAAASNAKRSKAHALNTHLSRCQLCR